MREIDVKQITEEIKNMCISINYELSDDMRTALKNAEKEETSETGKKVLGLLEENLKIAAEDAIPICQDTGMTVIFVEIGQDVHFSGGNLETAIQKGVAEGYTEGYLRKSVVSDPVLRENTNDNTPAIIHYSMTEGEKVKLTVTAKGFGSENMSRVWMLKPADGTEGIVNAVVETVKMAGPNACPPMVVGVGVGGNFEKCAILAKKALTRPAGTQNPLEHIRKIEAECLEKINALNIGPAGLGGKVTALGVHLETYGTHIAGLPVAVNICCHANRHMTVEL